MVKLSKVYEVSLEVLFCLHASSKLLGLYPVMHSLQPIGLYQGWSSMNEMIQRRTLINPLHIVLTFTPPVWPCVAMNLEVQPLQKEKYNKIYDREKNHEDKKKKVKYCNENGLHNLRPILRRSQCLMNLSLKIKQLPQGRIQF